MLHPVGSLPPHVYWRRRLILAGVLGVIVLVTLTIFALSSNGSTPEGASAAVVGPGTSRTAAPTTASSGSGSSSSSVDAAATTTQSSSAPASSSAASSAPASTAALASCIGAQLTVAAASSAPAYKVGDEPVLILQVTNNGPGNCTQDLADSQVELRVYNGAARVWGSHDCLVQPGTSVKTLVAGTTVGVQITWSGLSSQPGCAGTRQRVGAGTYTLYPYLAGAQGTASQFSIS